MAELGTINVPVTVTLANYDQLLAMYHELGNILIAFRPDVEHGGPSS